MEVKTHGMNLKKQETNIVRVFVIAFLLYIIFIITADARRVLALGSSFNWSVIPFILIGIMTNYLLRTVRFHYLLKKINIHFSFSTSFALFLSGLAMTVTPGKAGEAIKSYLIKKKTGHGYMQTIPLLIFERVMDGVSMIILSLGGIYLFPSRAVVFFFLLSIALVAAFLVCIYYQKPVLVMITFIEKYFPFVAFNYLIDFLTHARIFVRWRVIGVSLFISTIAWVLQGVSLYFLVRLFLSSAYGISLVHGTAYALFIFSFSSIAGFLALVPAGIGIAEGSLVSFLILFFHLTFTQAVFISLIFRFTTLWFGVSIGLIVLIRMLKGCQ